jgi:hypothetical protein
MASYPGKYAVVRLGARKLWVIGKKNGGPEGPPFRNECVSRS